LSLEILTQLEDKSSLVFIIAKDLQTLTIANDKISEWKVSKLQTLLFHSIKHGNTMFACFTTSLVSGQKFGGNLIKYLFKLVFGDRSCLHFSIFLQLLILEGLPSAPYQETSEQYFSINPKGRNEVGKSLCHSNSEL
jgi:hypothetical protein